MRMFRYRVLSIRTASATVETFDTPHLDLANALFGQNRTDPAFTYVGLFRMDVTDLTETLNWSVKDEG